MAQALPPHRFPSNALAVLGLVTFAITWGIIGGYTLFPERQRFSENLSQSFRKTPCRGTDVATFLKKLMSHVFREPL